MNTVDDTKPNAKPCIFHDELVAMVKEIHTAIIGNINDAKSEGLKPRVDRHERQLAAISRIVWLIVAALVTGVCATAFQMITK